MVEESMGILVVMYDDSCCVVSCVVYNVLVGVLVEGKNVEEVW